MATNAKKNTPSTQSINLDEILAKRKEATGSYNTFPFDLFGKTWTCVAPDLGDDEHKARLAQLQADGEDGLLSEHDAAIEFVDLWLGEEQADEWRKECAKVGISSTWPIREALRIYAERVSENPTQARFSSNRAQRRQR